MNSFCKSIDKLLIFMKCLNFLSNENATYSWESFQGELLNANMILDKYEAVLTHRCDFGIAAAKLFCKIHAGIFNLMQENKLVNWLGYAIVIT